MLQRHFFHARVRHAGGVAALPIVVLLQHEDVAVLNADLPRVIDDVLFILGLHHGSILPNPAAIQPKLHSATAVYHGHFISATFEVRDPDANYGVLTMAPAAAASGTSGASTDASGSGSADVELGTVFTDLPIASFRLHATVRHKASELQRRHEKLLSDRSRLDAFLAATGQLPAAAAAAKPRKPSAGRKKPPAADASEGMVAEAASAEAVHSGVDDGGGGPSSSSGAPARGRKRSTAAGARGGGRAGARACSSGSSTFGRPTSTSDAGASGSGASGASDAAVTELL